MTWRRHSASLLAVALLAGVAGAHANPVDTLWVPGVSDADDTALVHPVES